tara:strand:- start:338 stop:889 length:552 start_codon:yes stop_codon:yes gene_type:complete
MHPQIIMTLFQATLATGIILFALGAHFLWHGMRSAKSVQAFPRSQAAAYILLGSAAFWFLCKITQLGPADFGQYKNLLFILFLVVTIGSFIFVPDFLAVRGLAAIILLTAGALLDVGYMQYGTALVLKAFVYLAIIIALILGANPYKLRDFFEWLYKKEARPRVFGAVFVVYGLILAGVAFTY